MLGLADDGGTLWAIGVATATPTTQAAATMPASTQPASSQPTMTAAPAPPMPHLALFTRNGEGWQPAAGAALPASLPIDAPVSLTLIDHVPYLAVGRDGMVEVWQQRTKPGDWHRIFIVAGPPAPGAFKLLAGVSIPTLWIARPQADQLVLIQADDVSKTTDLQPNKAQVVDRTAVVANASIREIGVIDGKLMDQMYDPITFKAIGAPSPIALPVPKTQSLPQTLFETVIAASLVLAIFSSARRRREMIAGNPDLEALILADLGRRLIAGLIDAFPFIAPGILMLQMSWSNHPAAPQPDGTMHIDLLSILLFAAFAVYLLHTAVSETLTSRTIGKYLMGLRVVRVDGGTPDYSSLLIRNFLRLVDLGLVAPLAFIIFSPLRQRIGDVAAGTVVIRDRVRPEGNLIEPVKTDTAKTPAPEARTPQGTEGSAKS